MSTTYNPDDLLYSDLGDLRQELGRVFEICHSCRVCFNLCPSFNDLFNTIDRYDGQPARMTFAEQDKVTQECYQCKLCALRCPYVPPHEWSVDFPKLMMRAMIQRRDAGHIPLRERISDEVLSRTDLSGRVATAFADLVNPALAARNGAVRKVMDFTSGVSSQRLLPPYTKRRFSTWFRRDHVAKVAIRGGRNITQRVESAGGDTSVSGASVSGASVSGASVSGAGVSGAGVSGAGVSGAGEDGTRESNGATGRAADRAGSSLAGTGLAAYKREVAIFPTCFVEYMDPGIGRDLVGVLEHTGTACTLPHGIRCCGAPWLHSGRIDRFRKVAKANIEAMQDGVKRGGLVIVPQATCGYVMRKDYPALIDGEGAKLLASRIRDPAEYLLELRRTEREVFDSAFPSGLAGGAGESGNASRTGIQADGGTGGVAGKVGSMANKVITYHVACHTQAQGIGLKERDLLKLAGYEVNLVNKCAGIDGTWGYRSKNYSLARGVAQPMKRAIESGDSEEVCGDCHLANYAILEETGIRAVHPIQAIARAYGIYPD
ncbi:MAG: heterodisulfide reductase-related iron-sulfur binding cluster [Actinobacteria bacterium]|nr:heterodisulfide reductase-related iron-sulfur binding cluster [Actinomycetota bacterium]MCL5446288.1 heterodisulfide reductase-related iron-sulfur binding cluster [Actinomycetota bacterium]